MSTTTHWLSHPDGLGMATLVLAVVMSILCAVIVAMRTWTKYHLGTFSLDDGLMVIGLALFIACSVFTSLAVSTGLGTVDDRLTAWNDTETVKVSGRQPLGFSTKCMVQCSEMWKSDLSMHSTSSTFR